MGGLPGGVGEQVFGEQVFVEDITFLHMGGGWWGVVSGVDGWRCECFLPLSPVSDLLYVLHVCFCGYLLVELSFGFLDHF